LLELGKPGQAQASEGAWISTIHGFCSTVLRENALVCGLDPGFEVLDESLCASYKREAFEWALEDLRLEDHNCPSTQIAARYGPDRLSEMVLGAHTSLRSRGFTAPSLPEISGQAGVSSHRLLDAARVCVAELSPKAGKNATLDLALQRLACLQSLVEGLSDAQPADPDELEKLRLCVGSAKDLQTDAVEQFTECFEDYLQACKNSQDVADYALLKDLLSSYSSHYQQLKDGRAVVDFDDLQLFTRDLLAADTDLCQCYRDRFGQVMVDEFQDTDLLQTEILELVGGDNVFTVGDEFQSIYLFRGADVDLFRHHRDRMDARKRAVSLTTNFRSTREVLDALNVSFGAVFGPRFMHLRAGAQGGGADVAQPAVELLTVDQDAKAWAQKLGSDEPFGTSMQHAPIWRACEARLLAKRIEELTGPGSFDFADVAILLRARKDMGLYERALAERGIPTYVAGGRGYWSQRQVQDLRCFLATLANPLDEQALYQLLGGPMVGASLDALAVVGIYSKRLCRSAWHTVAQAFRDGGDGSQGLAWQMADSDRTALASFVDRFDRERRSVDCGSIEQLIDRAITQSGYDRALLSMPAGERRMANVRKLMRMARDFEAREGHDLRAFLDFIDQQGMMPSQEGEAPTETEGFDAVRLMTIHAAKGLEFPCVCVADLGRAANSVLDPLCVADDGRVGLRVATKDGGFRDGLSMLSIKQQQTDQAEAEERRIFYVAMSRAKSHLVLSGSTDTSTWPEPEPLKPPMRWIWRAFAPQLNEALNETHTAQIVHDYCGRAVRVRCVVCCADSVDEVLPDKERRPTVAADSQHRGGDTDAQRPAWLSTGASDRLLTRLSYTALSQYDRCPYRFYLERILGVGTSPASSLGTGGGGLKRGSVVHEFLQELSFTRPQVPAEEEINAKLAAHGMEATSAQASEVRGLLEAFAGSALCRRVGLAQDVRTEVPFAYLVELADAGDEIVLHGACDLYATEDEQVLIVDYKTDQLDPDSEQARTRYARQREVYALAALSAGASRVEVVNCFLHTPDRPVAETFSEDQAADLGKKIAEICGQAVSGDYERVCSGGAEPCDRCSVQVGLSGQSFAQAREAQ
jgi:ATP-dependent exoDNAse (exonuclease V) beta subunit